MSRVRRVMEPVVVNLSELDIRLLAGQFVVQLVSEGKVALPDDLPQSHFVSDKGTIQLIYPPIEIRHHGETLCLSRDMLVFRTHAHLAVEIEGRFRLGEVSRLHTIERENVIEHLTISLSPKQQREGPRTFSMRARLLDRPTTHSFWSSGISRKVPSASRF